MVPHALTLKGFLREMMHTNYADVSLSNQVTWPCPISREPRNVILPERKETKIYMKSPNDNYTRNSNSNFIILTN